MYSQEQYQSVRNHMLTIHNACMWLPEHPQSTRRITSYPSWVCEVGLPSFHSKSFKTNEFGLFARRHRILLCCDAKLCQKPRLHVSTRPNSREAQVGVSAAHIHLTWLSSAGTTQHFVARTSAEVSAAFPTARRLSNTCLPGSCAVFTASP